MGISITNFGDVNGRPVKLFTLKNKNGVSVSLSDGGARIVALNTPDKKGNFENVVVGFKDINTYLCKDEYIGAVVGRVANRIAGASFELNGKKYLLENNSNGNTLHGGKVGFASKVWGSFILKDTLSPAIRFSYYSADGEENFPANLWVDVIYELTEDNQLLMFFSGVADADTVLNLTNHAYFNLQGQGTTIHPLMLQIEADSYTLNNANMIPTGEILSVANTPLDFRQPKSVGQDLIKALPGYDHNFVLNKERRFAARLVDPVSGRFMEVDTTQPGMQIYTANHFDNSMMAVNGKTFPQYAGICFETQHFPDAVHHDNFPSIVLKKGTRYEHKVTYTLGVMD